MGLTQYRNRVFNLFYGLIQKRQLGLWDKLPSSQMRLYMFILQNGNCMSRNDLVDKLVEIGYSSNRNAAKQSIRRGLTNHILDIENDKLSVAEPLEFEIKFGSLFDSWRILMIPTSILSIIFTFMSPIMAMVCGVLTFVLILAMFVADFFNTVKY